MLEYMKHRQGENMKKICKLLLVCLLSVTLFGCSSDEKDVKEIVTSYLDCLKNKDLAGAAAISGEVFEDVEQTEDQKAVLDIMFKKFDYNITEVKVEEADALITLDITNINFVDLKDKAAENLEESNPSFKDLGDEEKIKLLVEEENKIIEATEPSTFNVTVKLVKGEDDKWQMTTDNTAFAKALLGAQ